MHQRTVRIISALRQDIGNHTARDAIHRLCSDIQHVWRDCVLDLATIVHVFLIQVLHGKTI
jgi:hypothetical protein